MQENEEEDANPTELNGDLGDVRESYHQESFIR
jgi:hypothetical protein